MGFSCRKEKTLISPLLLWRTKTLETTLVQLQILKLLLGLSSLMCKNVVSAKMLLIPTVF